MTNRKVRLMRERLGELLKLAIQAENKREADKILYMYERGEITRREAIKMLKQLRRKTTSNTLHHAKSLDSG